MNLFSEWARKDNLVLSGTLGELNPGPPLVPLLCTHPPACPPSLPSMPPSLEHVRVARVLVVLAHVVQCHVQHWVKE